MIGMFLPFGIYLQTVLGLTAAQAGLTIVALPLAGMVSAPLAGRLTDRIGGKLRPGGRSHPLRPRHGAGGRPRHRRRQQRAARAVPGGGGSGGGLLLRAHDHGGDA